MNNIIIGQPEVEIRVPVVFLVKKKQDEFTYKEESFLVYRGFLKNNKILNPKLISVSYLPEGREIEETGEKIWKTIQNENN